jgi:hypothetical protein
MPLAVPRGHGDAVEIGVLGHLISARPPTSQGSGPRRYTCASIRCFSSAAGRSSPAWIGVVVARR